MKYNLNKNNFFVAAGISLFIAVILFITSTTLGKQQFFLLLNTDAGLFFDNFFAFITHLGEESAWLALLLITLFVLKRKDAIMLLIAGVIYSTLFVQIIKNFVFVHEPRPITEITDISTIHTVKGVTLNTINSFPSGHTSLCFSVYLILCLLIPKKWCIPVGLLYALLVAYSRIYLAQHFPLDIAGGIIIAIISVWLAVLTQQFVWKKKLKQQ